MKRLLGVAIVVIIIAGAIFVFRASRPDTRAQKAVEETRQKLRQQGFKTDLSDFDFSTAPELRNREAILKATGPGYGSVPFRDHPNLMETVENGTVIVVWKQDSLRIAYPPWPGNNDTLAWEDFRAALHTNQAQVDAACDAVLSGPIGFDLDARGGIGVRLPHLAMLKNLTQTLGSRSVLDLHDGNLDAAWTNLMAATRLVTAWEPEPIEISQLVRFGNTKLAFNAIWQALQTNGWPDERLAQLQKEWEGADFFKNLPETIAFWRVSSVAACEQQRNSPALNGLSLAEFSKFSIEHPASAWSEWKYRSEYLSYLNHGSYEDETNLLIFYRDREIELRNALQAATWLQMRQFPGVTNEVPFRSKFRYGIATMMNARQLSLAFQKRGAGFLGRAAEAEARRRIIITAIALERYRGKLGLYPKALADLEPDFLKKVPVDFMDGQALRYRPTDDGHFILYSIGLDCVDNGGIRQTREQRAMTNREGGLMGMQPEADIVWPLPASSAVIAGLRQGEQAESPGQTNVSPAEVRSVTIRAQVPADAGTVYLTGNRSELGNWGPKGLVMTGSGLERTAVLHLPAGTQLEFKFTLGSWEREGLGPSGAVMPNCHLSVDADKDFSVVIPDFKKGIAAYLEDWKGSGVLGRLEYWKDMPSKFLTPTRNVEIWLPPGYDDEATNRYDVLYMHDGQNLFDPRIANTGVDWGVDEAIVRGVKAGKFPPMIVVGVWCTEQRAWEYSPWHSGTNYARFLIEELMPQVNQKFRTRTGPEHTSTMGSSMGGLISFWLCWKQPEVFGSAGCLSTGFRWNGVLGGDEKGKSPLIEREIAAGAAVPHGIRLYFDYGTRGIDSTFEPEQNRVNAWLTAQGLKEGEDFVVRKFPGADHNEAAWRARLDEPLMFLFGGSNGKTVAK